MVSEGVAAELSGMREEISRLTTAIGIVVETQALQTALLQSLLEAATATDGSEGSLSEALGRIADALDAQSEALSAIGAGVASLSPAT